VSVSEDRRIAVLEAASHHWGRHVAVTPMELLTPSGRGDVATRRQLEGLQREMRAETATMHAEVRAEIADGRRRFPQWTIATVIAMASVSTAVAALVR
jgi:hypothetical protein